MPFHVERGAEPIPGYRLIERLGGGGFGEVWKAEAPGGFLKAIKFVYGDAHAAGDGTPHTDQELKALSRVKGLRHPYILSLERYEIVDGRLIILMELADRNLWDRFRECGAAGLPGIPRDELLRFIEEAAEALDLMNGEYHLQHLDIKPQNLFVVHNHVKVGDFGLVKELRGTETRVTGGVTPTYAPPETFEGRVSRHSDQYSLAVVYQELLTGRRPFHAANVHQLILQQLREPPDLSALPASDQEPVRRALSKIPENRHASCVDFVRALRGLAVEPTSLEELTPPDGAAPDTEPSPVAAIMGGRKAAPKRAWISTPAETRPVPPPPLPELTGPGELFPALVIGVGGAGLSVLRHLRAELEARFGTPDALPNVRLLYIDTDEQAARAAIHTGRRVSLRPTQVAVIPLRRASHFLRRQAGRPPIDRWFNTRLLYRLQRTQETGGIRSLGRLAFVDNFPALSTRLRSELAACTDPAVMDAARRDTGLALRSNRPRVYVAAGLGGGTGGGVFIDLAYATRNCLRWLGHGTAEIVGLFVLPAGASADVVALGNAHAALVELNHYSDPASHYDAPFEDRESLLADSQPPYSRVHVLAPASSDSAPPDRVLAALLRQEVSAPLGRHAHEARQPQRRRWVCSSVGLATLLWPRDSLVRAGAGRFARRLVRHWISTEIAPTPDEIGDIIRERWTSLELGPEALVARLQDACTRLIGQTPASAVEEINFDVFPRNIRHGSVRPEAVARALARLEQLVGTPAESALVWRSAALDEALDAEAKVASTEWQQTIDSFTTDLVEEPRLRLPGAQEAVRQVLILLEQLLRHYEPLGADLSARADAAHERLRALVKVQDFGPSGRRPSPLEIELADLLRSYPQWRLQSMIVRRVTAVLTSLRGHLSDQLRELGFLRVRLAELVNRLPQETFSIEDAPDRHLVLPVGCPTLPDALDRLFPEPGPNEILELDERVQARIRERLVSLSHVCLTRVNLINNLVDTLVTESTRHAAERIGQADVVATYLQSQPSVARARNGLEDLFAAAAPTGATAAEGRPEFALVAVPDSSEHERLASLVLSSAPEARIIPSGSSEEVVFFRELLAPTLADFDAAGPAGRAAYEQMASAPQFPPHARADVARWSPLTGPHRPQPAPEKG